MAKIRMLSDDMIGRIAAGEVVERPAAAIKELVENSLDAGATAVTVEIRDGGLSYIRVADNGCGIDESDIRMAFERHATSKISREQDLFSVKTLGFRGEALASIAAVSHVTMVTRTADRETGLKIHNEGGRITDIAETACSPGTTMTVKELFYNVPVRKGFMKKAGQEASAVGELMAQLILSRPDVSFRYLSNGRTEYHSPGDGQLLTALYTIYGGQAAKTFRAVDGRENGLLISGYIGVGENARGNRSQELFFINGRVMHSKLLSEAVERGCRERVMIGKFPICALHITIAYEAVDVNVHPNKLEVRFRDETGVYEAVLSAVLDALKERDAFERPTEMLLVKESPARRDAFPPEAAPQSSVPASAPVIPESRATVTVGNQLPAEAAKVPAPEKPVPEFRPVQERKESLREPSAAPVSASPAHFAPPPFMPPAAAETRPAERTKEENAEQVNTILPSIPKPMKIFGAVFNTFILVEYADQLLLVDQHAVHERLLFDRLMREHGDERQPGQELLVPMILPVTSREKKVLEDNREALESIGVNAEAFGEHDITIRTIPVILGEAQTREFMTEVIGELEQGRDPGYEKRRAQLLQTACKHAVKGGEPLTEDQLRSLLDTMIETKVTPTCPHGRPLVVSISHRELDRKFKRIQQ